MVIKGIKNFENVNFRGVEIPKCEKKFGDGIPKSLENFGGGWEFPTQIKIFTPNWGSGNCYLISSKNKKFIK